MVAEPARAAEPAPEAAVVVRDLVKVYAPRRGRPPQPPALDRVTIDIPRGSLFGLLGPNGAGKSTLINILAGLVRITSGEARVWGFDVARETREAKAAIGVVPQELNIDPFFTPRELLDLQAGLYGVPKRARRTTEILELVGLADRAESYARALSGGMRRRLLIAKALVHDPPVLVLDEPTAGVDVELRQRLWDSVRRLNAEGVTILLTTHYLEEAERLCDRIAIIDHGRLVACDTTRALVSRLDSKGLVVTVAHDLQTLWPEGRLPAALARFAPEVRPPADLVFRYRPSGTRVAELLAAVQAAGLDILDLATEDGDLEALFLRLTRRTGAGVAAA